MLSSKWGMKNFITVIFLVFISTSCLRGPEEQSSSSHNNGSVDFKVVSISGTSKTISQSSLWSFPTDKVYNFRACLLTKVTNTPIMAKNSFTIHKDNKTLSHVETDKNGCINWEEKINFNITSDSKYVELERKIKGNKLYDGNVTIKIGVNPWTEFREESADEVVNLEESTLPTSHIITGSNSKLAFSGLYENSPGQDLLIDDGPETNIDFIRGNLVRVTIKIKPYIAPMNMSGRPSNYYINKGKFLVYPSLIANELGPDGSKKLLLTNLLPEEIEVSRNGYITYQKKIELNKEVTSGEVQLALKIDPINSPVYMNSYEGLHTMGAFDELIGSHSPTQIAGTFVGKPFNYGNFVESTNNFNELITAGLAFKLNPIRFRELDIRFVRIAPGETATKRTVVYRTQTQVINSITGKPIKKQAFKVKKNTTGKFQLRRSEYSGELEETVYTNDDGLLRWTDEITHKYYISEQFYYPSVSITHLDSNYNETLTMAINPWNSGWTFGSDIRGKEAEYEKMNKQEKRASVFMIDAFRYQTIRFRYEIDQFMTLNVKKAVVMALDPITQRYTIEEGRKAEEPLRDGIYLVKVALVKYFIDPFGNGSKLFKDEETGEHTVLQTSTSEETKKGEYLTVIKKLVRVQGGRITTPLEFSMRDLRMMSIRSNIMVQLETVDEQRLLRDNTIDKKLRQLVDEYNYYHSKDLTEEQRIQFMDENDRIFEEEREKLKTAMKRELEDLQKHRLSLANAEAERYKALNAFEDRIRDERSVQNRRQQRQEIMSMNEKEFQSYILNIRNNMDQMEKKFSNYWRQWNKDMGLPSNEIQDWEEYNKELATSVPFIPKKMENPDRLKIGLGENKSVYDQLAQMQIFMKDFGLPDDIGKRDLDEMQLNNYSQNPAAPFINLDLYVEHAGLERRTFIGPCTLIANDNMSEMRPTDTIDEQYCDRIDCSESLVDFGFKVDNSEFEQSKYHGAIKPFANMHVDHVIEMYKRYEKNYMHNMKALSQVGTFLDTYNLDYVSLSNNFRLPKPKRFKFGCAIPEDESNGDYDTHKYDECYEDADDRIINRSRFFYDLSYMTSEELLIEYFSFKYYNADLQEEAKINTLNSVYAEAGEVISEMGEDVVEKLTESNTLMGLGANVLKSVFIDGANADKYLEKFHSGRLEKFDQYKARNLLRGLSPKLNLLEAVNICSIVTHNIGHELRDNGLIAPDAWKGKRSQGKGRKGTPIYTEDYLKTKDILLRELCLRSIEFNPKDGSVDLPHIAFDRRYRVIETGTYEHKEGKNLNINVGMDFTVGQGKVVQNGTSISANVSVSGGVGADAGFFKAEAGIGAQIGKEASEGEEKSIGRGSSVSTATFLVVQQATMEIELRKFERCFTAQLAPSLFYDKTSEDLGLKDGLDLRDKEVQRVLTKGIMVCEGNYNQRPQKVIENYYYLTQHFTAGDMLDEGNLLNHIWLLPLRGERDFYNFMNIMNAKPIDKNGEVLDESTVFNYPNERLRTNYEDIIPSFPGFYTLQEF